MFRIAVVENDSGDLLKLKNCLINYSQKEKIQFEIFEFSDGDMITDNYKSNFDIILMDIEMEYMDGLTAAEKIRELDKETIIIFVTNSPQYAIRGYKVNAFDYILKPIAEFSFGETMSKAIARLDKKQEKYITIPTAQGTSKLAESRICYVEVQDKYLFYHTLDGVYQVRDSLKNVTATLDSKLFIMCSRCYLVNLSYVDSYRNDELVVNTDTIKMSRGRSKPFLDALNSYINNR